MDDDRMQDPRRGSVWTLLSGHEPADAKEATDLLRMAAYVRTDADAFSRHEPLGHFTASAVVASPDLSQVLLVHHRGLDRWLQPGGHMEVHDADPLHGALREAHEETGLEVRPHPRGPQAGRALIDVDIHPIPVGGGMPGHDHLDLRFLLVADPDAPLRPDAAETKAAQWYDWDQIEAFGFTGEMARLLDKVRRLRPMLRA